MATKIADEYEHIAKRVAELQRERSERINSDAQDHGVWSDLSLEGAGHTPQPVVDPFTGGIVWI